MRSTSIQCLALAAAISLVAGCGSDSQDTELDPAGLESAFQETPGETDALAADSADESTTDTIVLPGPSGAAGSEVSVNEVAAQAAMAIRNDEVTEAMVLLQTLRRARNLSPNQLTVVQDQMAALQTDLANKAASGDPRAKQALELMQQSTRW